MIYPVERMIAMRYLRSRKKEGFVSVIAGFSFMGIMLGVATLIIVMAVMNGFRQELITRILGLNGHINVYGFTGTLEDYETAKAIARTVDGVQAVIPSIEGQALMSVSGSATGTIVRGISAEDFATKPTLAEAVEKGELSNFAGDKIAMGAALAKKYRLKPGDRVTLIAPQGKPGPFGTIPRSRSYEIGLLFEVGMYEYDSSFIFMPLSAAQKFFQIPEGSVSTLEISIKDLKAIDQVKMQLSKAMYGHGIVNDWRDRNSSFFNALQVERNVMFLILTLIIIVAAFNIISSMIMLVKDKGHDIAIMRTMGCTRGAMMRIFMMTGASIGLIGTIAGAALGISFALNIEAIRQWLEGLTGTELFSAEIYFLSQLPAEIDWNEVFAVLLMAFSLSILATIYPAWRAARMDPVEALRYE